MHIHFVMSDCNETQMNYNKIWSFKKEKYPKHNVAEETFSRFSLRAIVKVNNSQRQTYKMVLTLM